MSPPRYIVEGQLVFVTCGAVGRSFRFLPTRRVVELLWFVFSVMVAKHRIDVHEVFWMSNHFHVVLTDVRGNLPAFMREMNSLIARGLNALRGTTGTNIEKGYNIVTPVDDDKIIEHAVYSLANACEAGLVKRARHWKGVSSLKLDYGRPVTFARPQAGLWKGAVRGSASIGDGRPRRGNVSRGRARQSGRTRMPESVEFTLVRPPVTPNLSDDELRALIRSKVADREAMFIRERKAAGRTALGMSQVLRLGWNDLPTTSRALFGTTPRVSGASKLARVQELEVRLGFEAAYAIAREAFTAVLRTAGLLREELARRLREVLFPHGTYLLRCRYNVRCEPGP